MKCEPRLGSKLRRSLSVPLQNCVEVGVLVRAVLLDVGGVILDFAKRDLTYLTGTGETHIDALYVRTAEDVDVTGKSV